MSVEALRSRRHDPPPGWPPEVFEAVTSALADALVSAVNRQIAEEREEGEE